MYTTPLTHASREEAYSVICLNVLLRFWYGLNTFLHRRLPPVNEAPIPKKALRARGVIGGLFRALAAGRIS